MKPALTFDAAQTLIDVTWDPGVFMRDCAAACGIYASEEDGIVFNGILRTRWKEYCAVNETRNPLKGDEFWAAMTHDWLTAIGEDPSRTANLIKEGVPLLYSSRSPYFKLYEDTLPTLEALSRLGIRMAIISNWDYSLHRILEMLQIRDYFEVVLASLEEGVEKPDPRLFEIALTQMGIVPSQAVHIGDNPIDDIQGARNAGMEAITIDRNRTTSERRIIHKLTELPRVLDLVELS